jgi:hypothetical protein
MFLCLKSQVFVSGGSTEEKEAEKKAAKDKTNDGQSDRSVAEQEHEKATSLPSEGIKSEGKKMKKKQQEKEVRELDVDANTHSNMEMDREDSTSEEDFWVPPVGDRWDMDSGGPDRWTNTVPGAHTQKSLDNKSDSEMDLGMQISHSPFSCRNYSYVLVRERESKYFCVSSFMFHKLRPLMELVKCTVVLRFKVSLQNQ